MSMGMLDALFLAIELETRIIYSIVLVIGHILLHGPKETRKNFDKILDKTFP